MHLIIYFMVIMLIFPLQCDTQPLGESVVVPCACCLSPRSRKTLHMSSARRQVGGTYSITQINLHLMVYVKVWNQGAKHRLHRRAISSNSMAMVPLSLREFSFAPASFFIGPARYCYGHESLNSPQHPAMSKNFHKGYIAIIFQKSIKMSAADRILPVLQ